MSYPGQHPTPLKYDVNECTHKYRKPQDNYDAVGLGFGGESPDHDFRCFQ